MGEFRHPITLLVEAADDMVYSSVDLEDAVKKGIIGWDTICDEILTGHDELRNKCETYIAQFEPAGDTKLSKDELLVQIFRTHLMYEHVAASVSSFTENYTEIMNGSFHKELLTVGDSADLLKRCGDVAKKHVYSNRAVILSELEGRAAIRGVLDALWPGVRSYPHTEKREFNYKLYTTLSANYRTTFEHDYASSTSEGHRTYLKLRLLIDYVAGMTDTFAIAFHRQLAGT